ncbi:MAG: M20/M25/M40 family metallo-hydrolase, partial [Butyricimonas faecihominis]
MSKEIMDVFHSISSDEIMEYVHELCKEEYNGRLAGTGEYMKCAFWCAEQLCDFGLEPAGDDGSYLQHFRMPTTSLIDCRLKKVGNEQEYVFPRDFYPGMNSDSGKVENAEVVYAGYGITAPEYGYDDYEGIDVKGKIVIIERGIPYRDKDEKKRFDLYMRYASESYKLPQALKKGAAAVLLVGKLAHTGIAFSKGMIYTHVDPSMVDELVTEAGYTRDGLKKQIGEKQKPCSFNTGCRLNMDVVTRHYPYATTCNVIGVIKGVDTTSSIVLGAHLDHLGNNGLMFPGALDNASGVALQLAVAKALAASGIKPEKNIVFAFFGAEERGIKGAIHYLNHPTFPLDKTMCMLNIDMVGNGNGLSVWGAESFPAVAKIFAEVNDRWLHREFEVTPYERAVSYS